MAADLVRALQQWGYPRDVQPESLAWAFDYRPTKDLLAFLVRMTDRNFVSDDDLEEYQALEARGVPLLDGDALQTALDNVEAAQTTQSATAEALQKEIEDLEAQCKWETDVSNRLEAQHQMLSQVLEEREADANREVSAPRAPSPAEATARAGAMQAATELQSVFEQVYTDCLALHTEGASVVGLVDDLPYYNAVENFDALTTYQTKILQGADDLMKLYFHADRSDVRSVFSTIHSTQDNQYDTNCQELKRFRALAVPTQLNRVDAKCTEATAKTLHTLIQEQLTATQDESTQDWGAAAMLAERHQAEGQACMREIDKMWEDIKGLAAQIGVVYPACEVLHVDYSEKRRRFTFYSAKLEDLGNHLQVLVDAYQDLRTNLSKERDVVQDLQETLPRILKSAREWHHNRLARGQRYQALLAPPGPGEVDLPAFRRLAQLLTPHVGAISPAPEAGAAGCSRLVESTRARVHEYRGCLVSLKSDWDVTAEQWKVSIGSLREVVWRSPMHMKAMALLLRLSDDVQNVGSTIAQLREFQTTEERLVMDDRFLWCMFYLNPDRFVALMRQLEMKLDTNRMSRYTVA